MSGVQFNERDRKKIEAKVKEGYNLIEIVVKNRNRFAIFEKNENYIAIKLSKLPKHTENESEE
ncbi:MAG: Uncharacterized protein XD58_0853 [Thermotoga sp. 50_1627]|nr:MAG: Uncharacterized protein XD45_1148 [Thermotoga sp. 50_64]KUK25130.1 MAG: Uncharacterized protein XD58_0853 [Thermotoga sp. 50_1627]MBC7115686.1 hypothetical protein [Pseudothermotoga sp.]MDK2923744.1 hypothetical protein [Pseudothermotoga sp.]HBT38505.1 hypothetical protein [Pseudothermotoga sp.]